MYKFKHPHVILPVIHIETNQQALHNAKIAFEHGADGIWLIAHADTYKGLNQVYLSVRDVYPDRWVGVNCLDLRVPKAMEQIRNGLFPGINGLWVDDAGIHDGGPIQEQAIVNQTAMAGWDGMYFGGVAFKYVHDPNTDVRAVASVASALMDVVTTSGAATGKAADVDKISTMAEAASPTPLAIASGLTSENVSLYLPYAKYLMVATGINASWENIDPSKLKSFVEVVRQWENSPQSL